MARLPRWLRWSVGIVLCVSVLTMVVPTCVDEPLRQKIESAMNANLKGSTVHLGAVRFHPLSFALDLVDWTVVQDANPEPPLAEVSKLTASVQWVSLLDGHLVADFRVERPALHFDREQAANEVNDPTPVAERGRDWQHAFEQIYPLKINEIRIVDGDLTYTPGDEFKPLHMTHVNSSAGNIRNIRSADRKYPSDLHLDAVVFERGTLHLDGHADFLAEPHAGLQTDVALQDLPLPYLTGVLRDYVAIRKGAFSAWGTLEYAPTIQRVDLQEVVLSDADVDYVLTKANAARSRRLRQRAADAATRMNADPQMQLRAKHVRMTNGTVGLFDKAADPNYRVFLSSVDLTAQDFSNQRREGAGTVDIAGKFMGTGPTTMHAVFRPEAKSPNFDLAVHIEDTDMRTMNNLLRAKANIDVTAGVFAFYSELRVRDDTIDGYVKPLFHDVTVYDPTQDGDKPLTNKIYQGVVGGLATLLENRTTGDVATKVSVRGPIEEPGTSSWELIARLVQNAFFKAILPGLDRTQG